ncbi:translation initiation factor IF-2-like [Wyeomyia smithii]|uniref:translation initiation factor IF-2-like n=1 Tax=Wyeomyia smithii TaxID=174621 RepID=UPI0024680327|nr:translation initiation factor IF-2-like [Wyeomyia smithii]
MFKVIVCVFAILAIASAFPSDITHPEGGRGNFGPAPAGAHGNFGPAPTGARGNFGPNPAGARGNFGPAPAGVPPARSPVHSQAGPDDLAAADGEGDKEGLEKSETFGFGYYPRYYHYGYSPYYYYYPRYYSTYWW